MATRRWLLLSWVLIGIVGFNAQPHADDPTAAFYGIGQLLTTLREHPTSMVRDAVQVDGVIYAVGGASTRLCTGTSGGCGVTDTAVLWKFDETTPAIPATLQELPNFAANTLSTTSLTAYAITNPPGTADTSVIASQARNNVASGSRVAVQVTVTPSAATNKFLPLPGASPGGLSAPTAISRDGTILYGSTNEGTFNPGFPHRGVRFDASTTPATSLFIPFLGTETWNPVAERGTSADGSVAVGSSFSVDAASVSTPHRAYRYLHGSGVAAIPLLDGGSTFNDAIAVSPDGDLVLVTGNSTANPNGEAYLWRASTSVKTPLGSPNTGLVPGGFISSLDACLAGPVLTGGMTADASVVVMSFRENDFCNGTTGYFRNARGWFHLTSALGAHGVDLLADGWDVERGLEIHGISPDGTLVFGAGVRDGKIEGFVAKFGVGDLANFNPQPQALANTSLVGAWALCDPDECDFTGPPEGVLVFTADGAYFLVGDDGFERGFYTYTGSVLTFTTLFDTDGAGGASQFNGVPIGPLVVDGDTIATGGPIGGFRFSGSAAEPLVGAWVQGNALQPDSAFVTVFLGSGRDNTIFQANDNPLFGPDGSGVGTYTWAPDVTCSPYTHELNIYSPGEPDDLHNCGTIAPDGLTLDALDDDGHSEFHFARVIEPAAIPAITSSISAVATSGYPFTYQVTATNAASTFGAAGLPSELDINTETGFITGTPSGPGVFEVTLSASNGVVGGSAALTLVVAAPAVTPVGSNVTVTPEVPPGAEPVPVTIQFETVETAGETAVITIDPETVPDAQAPPAGFTLGDPPVYYEIETTATFTGPVEVCFGYAGITFSGFPRLLHYDEALATWVDITTTVDTATQTICGLTSSFSPFALASTALNAVGFHRPIKPIAGDLNTVKGGSTVALKFNVFAEGNVEITDPAVITDPDGIDVEFEVSPVSCQGGAPESSDVITATGGTGLRYDTTSGHFVQNWKTPKSPGCYLVRVKGEGLLLSALFKVK